MFRVVFVLLAVSLGSGAEAAVFEPNGERIERPAPTPQGGVLTVPTGGWGRGRN